MIDDEITNAAQGDMSANLIVVFANERIVAVFAGV